MSKPDAAVLAQLAPSGKLRAAINFGNSVLAQKDPATGEPKGITPDLARELGRRLGVPVELVTYDAAGKVFDAVKTGAWDIAFVAIEPVRAAEIEFSAAYVIIEGTYMVPKDSPLKTVADWPLRLRASATKPDAFTSSTNMRRYSAPAVRPLGVPIACWISMKWPSITRISG